MQLQGREWVQFCSDAHSRENMLSKTSETVTGDVRDAEHFMHQSAVVPHSRHVSLWQAFVPRVLTHTHGGWWFPPLCSRKSGLILPLTTLSRYWWVSLIENEVIVVDLLRTSWEKLLLEMRGDAQRRWDDDEKMFEMIPDQLRCFYDADILKPFPFDR